MLGNLLGTSVSAQTVGDKRYVASEGVRLRSGPGLNYEVLWVMRSGAAVTVVAAGSTTADGYTWLNVKHDSSGTTGWAAGEFLTTSGNSDWPAGIDVFVDTDLLNLRATANGTILTTYPYGTGATTLGGATSAGSFVWVEVSVDDGTYGWFAADYLSLGGSPTPGWPAGTAVYVDTDSLNLRNGPSLGSASLGHYGWGVNAEIIEGPRYAGGYTWYRVEVYADDARGWFAGEFLAEGNTNPTTDRIRVVDGPVNLRSEPGLSASVIASLPTGEGGDLWSTSVPYVDGYTWIRIRADSTQDIGWVATLFINYV